MRIVSFLSKQALEPVGPGNPRQPHLQDQLQRHQPEISMTTAVLLMSAVLCQVFPGRLWICGISLFLAISRGETCRGALATLLGQHTLGQPAFLP